MRGRFRLDETCGIPITLDVTDSESCAAAARKVAAHSDGLGAVINFAGVLDLGPLMEVSEERLGRILDVDVLGTHRVNRAMREQATQAAIPGERLDAAEDDGAAPETSA